MRIKVNGAERLPRPPDASDHLALNLPHGGQNRSLGVS